MPATRIELEGKLTIRRAIHIAASPERVWREFESFDRFAAWFGVMVDEYDRASGVPRPMGHRVITYEPREGGWIEMEVDVEGKPRRFGGRITVFEPQRELTFEDDWIPGELASPLLLTLQLTPHEEGTLVELIQHGFERLGARGIEEQRGHEGGWTNRQLIALREIVEGA
jgi:uncharacterized protein YndB with AHSA1/START domain